MEKEVNAKEISTCKNKKVTNKHFYHIEIFLAAIDAILSEMNHWFGEVSSELLVCMACLNPSNSFSNFDVMKLVRLAQTYAQDFKVTYIILLRSELRNFINRVRRTQDFLGCVELSKVGEIMVKLRMDKCYQLVYRLIELTLILPVAIASVERIFSPMSIIKIDFGNKMDVKWLNDLMICYNYKEIFITMIKSSNRLKI